LSAVARRVTAIISKAGRIAIRENDVSGKDRIA